MATKAAYDLWRKNAFADRRYDRAATGEPLALERFGYRWLRLPG